MKIDLDLYGMRRVREALYGRYWELSNAPILGVDRSDGTRAAVIREMATLAKAIRKINLALRKRYGHDFCALCWETNLHQQYMETV